MRIAHITDIHVMVRPSLKDVSIKRLLGTANLFLAGRRKHFSKDVQSALVEHVTGQTPDAIICTGDLTAQATPAEFEAAHRLLSPLFSRFPSVLIPGNHDVYTPQNARERSIEALFGQWTGRGDWPRITALSDTLSVVALDTCRAHPFLSSGTVRSEALERLDEVLSHWPEGKGCILAIHYPLRDRRGAPYGPPGRALTNADEVEAILCRHDTKITAIMHGHEHHGFRTELQGPNKAIPILNPGASGYAWLPEKRRTAHYNLYTFGEGFAFQVTRFTFDGERQDFVLEPGGAYATGG